MPRSPHPTTTLPPELGAALERAGYYPAIVGDVVAAAIAGQEVRSHLVHLETTFDSEVVRRHITVLVLTDSRIVVAHADDHHEDEAPGAPVSTAAIATTESIPLGAVRGVMLTHVVTDPATYVPGSLGNELTLTLGWGAVSRIDLVPAGCGDPNCEADHGYEGTVTADDIALRVSAVADGPEALERARRFAHDLSIALGHA